MPLGTSLLGSVDCSSLYQLTAAIQANCFSFAQADFCFSFISLSGSGGLIATNGRHYR